MTRQEHLQHCKERAMEYLNKGDLDNAFMFFSNELGNHPDTSDHIAREKGLKLMFSGHLSTYSEVKNFIEGTN